MNIRFRRLSEILGKSNMATCWPSFLYGAIYGEDKAHAEEEKEVCFTIYQFEILLYELLELLLTSIHNITLRTCQLSRFCRESRDFLSFLTVSRQGSSISQVLGKIILKWFKFLNQNNNGKLTRNACAIKWKTNKEEYCSYFFVSSCDFRLCSINLIVFERGVRPGNEV